jgi:hypothetical protein
MVHDSSNAHAYTYLFCCCCAKANPLGGCCWPCAWPKVDPPAGACGACGIGTSCLYSGTMSWLVQHSYSVRRQREHQAAYTYASPPCGFKFNPNDLNACKSSLVDIFNGFTPCSRDTDGGEEKVWPRGVL